MDLICYLHPGWDAVESSARQEATRDWMTNTPESYAYRCLPLDIANAHGWEILWPFGFSACWAGGVGTDAVLIDTPPRRRPRRACQVSLFGQGMLTFHIAGLFRTAPGWNLWVGGSPNRPKDAIYPLTGIVETDWAPYTFTMNWRFTRPNHWVRFRGRRAGSALSSRCKRGYLEAVTPRLVSMIDAPDTMRQFNEWSRSRTEFHGRMARETPRSGSDKWQKGLSATAASTPTAGRLFPIIRPSCGCGRSRRRPARPRRQHRRQNPVAANEMMIERRGGVHPDQGQQPISEKTVNTAQLRG